MGFSSPRTGLHGGWSGLLFSASLLAVSPEPLAALDDAPPAADDAASETKLEGPTPRFLEEIEVRERADDLVGIAMASSEGTTGREDLERRPIQRVGELIETVPGAIATQHAGGGKANQYFLRGFNLDHGTDFAVSVGGVPVNQPTHGHGQGYADMNFVIPETIERIRFHKGLYRAESGDFSSAGGAEVDLVAGFSDGLLKVTGGSFDYQRLLVAKTLPLGDGALDLAVEGLHDDGPWERGDDYRRWNGFAVFRRGDAARGGSLTLLASDGEWRSSDQIPRRAVEEGRIDRYGRIDDDSGGSSSRWSLVGELHRGDATSLSELRVYTVRYRLDLFSDFTYFLEDPERGDQFEQLDQRWTFGLKLARRGQGELGGRRIEWGAGLDGRYDAIDNGLFRTAGRERTSTVRADGIGQLGASAWVEGTLALADGLRLGLGVRLDHYGAEVDSNLAANSGSATDWLLSPKASLAWRVADSTELYLAAGGGYHSNDARGATIRVDPVTGEPAARVPPLVRAWGSELGVRFARAAAYHSTLTAYWLELDSELVFVGDGGSTEAGRPSRRLGLEWTNIWTPRRHFVVDLDATWTKARFTDPDPAGDRIPGAIDTTVAAGVALVDFSRWETGLRLRWFSGGALLEDDSIRWGPTALLSARIAVRLSDRLRLELEGFNLLDRQDEDIAYFYPSRLPGEPAEGVEDVHFHPVERPGARLTVEWRF
ncbi:MAG: TonB-dependent receptor [Acidobacteria bacterium]|nr:TonB-dependent receptor [Acidobacteriota bacterium]